MSDHSHFEELTALSAGGFLSDQECRELREHTMTCAECRNAEEEFTALVRSGLALTVPRLRELMDKVKVRTGSDTRALFLRRARHDGIVFSGGAEESSRSSGWRAGFVAATATALVVAIGMSAFYRTHRSPVSRESIQVQQQGERLREENAALTAKLAQLNESIATQRGEIQDLRGQLANAADTGSHRSNGEQVASHEEQVLDESQNQAKLLGEAKDEVARVNDLRAYDQATLVAQEVRIAELSDKLRVASATLDMERQLADAGKNVRELMVARQLHVIDVRDTDPDGKPSKAFGRVFLTEGKSLTFYAFDLNEGRSVNAKGSFEVWAVPQAGKNSPRSLGFLRVDAEAEGRWVLKVDNPEQVKELSSVFVTSEPAAGGKQPSGQKMLYAYLGQANHP